MDAPAIVSLNVAFTAVFAGTPAWLAAGFEEVTDGRVVSVGGGVGVVGGGGGGGGGDGDVVAGLLAASPGKALAVISAMLVNPSPSESAFSMVEKEWPAPPNAVAYALKVFVSPPGWQRLQLFSAVPEVPYVLLKEER
jgi:hypothetical protein